MEINSYITQLNNVKEENLFSPSYVYVGEVIIEHYQKNKKTTLKRHNKGQIALFNAITQALAGYNIDKLRPSKIMLFGPNEKELLVQKINFSTIPNLFKYDKGSYVKTTDQDNDTIEYRFVIPSSSFLFGSSSSLTIKSLKLYNNQDSICAVVENLTESVSLESNFIIKWKLRFESNS